MISHDENVKQVFLHEKTQQITQLSISIQIILQCIQDLKMEVYA